MRGRGTHQQNDDFNAMDRKANGLPLQLGAVADPLLLGQGLHHRRAARLVVEQRPPAPLAAASALQGCRGNAVARAKVKVPTDARHRMIRNWCMWLLCAGTGDSHMCRLVQSQSTWAFARASGH